MHRLSLGVSEEFRNFVLDHIRDSGGRYSGQTHFLREAIVARIAQDKEDWKNLSGLAVQERVANSFTFPKEQIP